ncbi:MAG: tetratricopeptide repeat protein [Thermoguttaceae bacterium]
MPRPSSWTVPLLLLASCALLLPRPLLADEADDQYAVAAGLYARQQWKLAVHEFQVFAEKYPNHPKLKQSIFFTAEALVQLGQSEEATARFREYLKRDPSGPYARSARFRAGEAFYLAGKLDQAKAELRAFVEKYPADDLNAYALPYLGDIALAQKDIAAAENYFRQGLSRFPQGQRQDDCRFGLGRALEKQDKNEEAERLYLAVAAKTGIPLAADAQFRLGAVQYAMGKYHEAIELFAAFETRLAGSPRQPAARLGHGWALMKLGKPAEAGKVFEQIVGDEKLGIEARYWLGLSQKAQKDWPGAAETLLAAAAADPSHRLVSAMRFHAGDALFLAGQAAAARREFDQVLAAGGEDEWVERALHGKIAIALLEKDHVAIDRDAAEFSRRFPHSDLKIDVQRIVVRSLIERKQYQQATAILRAFTGAESSAPQATSDPQRLEDRYLLTLAYEGLKRYDDALATLAPVLQSATGSLKADALLTKASLHMAKKEFREALAALETWQSTISPGIEPPAETVNRGRGQLAICYARAGQVGKAKQVYRELLRKNLPRPILVSLTEQLAEAAYAAGDVAWSNGLFQWLAGAGQPADEQRKGLSGLGWSQFKAGDLEAAAATFDKLLRQGPPASMAAEAALVRGQILEKLNRPDPAVAMYDRVIRDYPSSKELPKALICAARLHQALHQNQEAAALFERVTKEFANLDDRDGALYQWAWTLADLGKAGESAEVFEQLRKEYPHSRYWADATYRILERAFAAKEFARSRKLAAALLAAKPAASLRESTMLVQGQIEAAEGKWKEALAAFQAVVREFPAGSSRPIADLGTAEAIYRQGDYLTSGERFQQLAKEGAGRPPAWRALVHLRLAQSLCQQKKWQDALAIAAKIESEFPRFEEQYEADYIVGRCLAAEAEFAAAREAYGKVIRSKGNEKSETAAKAQLMIAETYLHQKDYAAALREYLRVELLYAYPTEQAAALLQAGKCHELLGEWKEATGVYERLIKSYPDTKFAKEASDRAKISQQQAASPRGA